MTVISMFDHMAVWCSIHVINPRCDSLLDRSVVMDFRGVAIINCFGHQVLLYTVNVKFKFTIDTFLHRGRRSGTENEVGGRKSIFSMLTQHIGI